MLDFGILLLNPLVVPYCYIRIFLFRKRHRPAGLTETNWAARRKTNMMMFTNNMTVWLIEFASVFIVSQSSVCLL